MFSLKYYDDYKAIRAAQRETKQDPGAAAFDLDQLGADSLRHRLTLRLIAWFLRVAFRFFRAVWPIARFGRLVVVSRAVDVSYVLNHPERFVVPYGLEMTELAGGENFVLGLEGCAHREQNEIIRRAIRRDDPERIAALSRDSALALIRASGGRIDVMKDLLTRVATEASGRYFGLRFEDPDAFAEWTLSVSALLFADPKGDAATRQLALNGAARLRAVIDRSIHTCRRMKDDDSLLGRLLRAQACDPGLTDEKIRAILIGLVTGFVPTNTLAAGKILQELLRRPEAFAAAVEAARAAEAAERDGDTTNPHKAKLEAILFEAARLNPALAPGQWRYVPNDTAIVSVGGRATPIARGSVLMVATMSALRDSTVVTSPNSFDPARKPSDIALMFGEGAHECLGKHLAMKQITETFQVLLAQPNLRVAEDKWGTLRWTGPFPRRLDMQFDATVAPAVQTMLTICAPVMPDSVKTVRELIRALDCPAPDGISRAFDDTGIVHFASLAVIEAGDARTSAPYLLLELNVDGTAETAIPVIAQHTQRHLGRIFAHTLFSGADLAETFKRCALALMTRPWGATGLNFNGTPEFPVADIAMQQRLAAFARRTIALFVEGHIGLGNRAMSAVQFTRDLINQHPRYVEAAKRDDRIAALLAEGAQFREHLVLPSRKRLKISDWMERSRKDALVDILKSGDFQIVAGALLALFLLLTGGIYAVFGNHLWLGFPGPLLVSVTGGVISTVALLLMIAGVFALLLRYHENKDIPDDRDPELAHIRAIAARENRAGHAQNHFMAVTLLKPGWFRKLTLALSLWGIKQLVTHVYRPGFVLNMGTIHYAKWFRVPDTDKLIFLSNFDGSWESYLEDFIMKAHPGQTAAWSNGVGFPKTRFLIYDGAEDGDRFKRWVRRQQVPTQFWYSRFPDLTTDQIRNNAVIHHGLARAHSDSAARSWLDCFGSMQQPGHTIETEDVQSLVFRGFKHSPFAAYVLVKLPADAKRRTAWLRALLGLPPSPHSHSYMTTAENCKLTFGEFPFSARRESRDLATFAAFTAHGLKALGLPADRDDGLATFASAFNLGMHNRGRILGDRHDDSPWRWSDADRIDEAGNPLGDVRTTDAIIIVYGSSADQCRAAVESHRGLLGADAFIDVIFSAPVGGPTEAGEEPAPFIEHFGFRDGISQPVIRGTHSFVDGVPARDVVAPGEFILGYTNNQDFQPPSIRVSADTDVNDRLPDVCAASSPFPAFDAASMRDFGRNGSFLVVRQMQQHVGAFENFTERAADTLRRKYRHLGDAVGASITADWIAAKMMGRRRDGSSLTVQPGDGRAESQSATLNDFAFAHDDPQGLRCPFGAHIRRANPRDGLRPDDDMQQAITNRHRLLRRGRAYEFSAEEAAKRGGIGPEKGLIFTCLCADLERQFEFVQQTWIGSSSFHGLSGEVDPILGWQDPTKPAVFTIPTPSGPVTLDGLETFVTVRAGGYFFMPSRAAIAYLLDRCRTEAKASMPAALAACPAAKPHMCETAAAGRMGEQIV